jgi:hypothetical protein
MLIEVRARLGRIGAHLVCAAYDGLPEEGLA